MNANTGTYRLVTRHPDGSQTIVLATYRHLLDLLDNAHTGDTVTIGVGSVAGAGNQQQEGTK